jgi:hypothetical protein
MLSSNHSDGIILDDTLEVNEIFVFEVIGHCGESHEQKDSNIDGEALEPAEVSIFLDCVSDHRNESSDCESKQDTVIQSFLDGIQDLWDLRERLLIFAIPIEWFRP